MPNEIRNTREEVFLTISVQLKTNTPLEKVGFELAYEQFKIKNGISPVQKPVIGQPDYIVSQSDNLIKVSNSKFEFVFDKQQGTIARYTFNSKPVMKKGLHLKFWRPPTETDLRENGYLTSKQLQLNNLHEKINSVQYIPSKENRAVIYVNLDIRIRKTKLW